MRLSSDDLPMFFDDTHRALAERLRKAAGRIGEAEAKPVAGDVLAAEVQWQKPLKLLRGQVVRLEFRVRHAALFGFEFSGAPR